MLAVDSFERDTTAPRTVLLLSDGDDPLLADEEWRRGVNAARAGRVPVHTVGIGDPNQESVIIIKEVKKPGRDKTVLERPLKFEGNDVKTKLEEKILRDIAESTGGVYLAGPHQRFSAGEPAAGHPGQAGRGQCRQFARIGARPAAKASVVPVARLAAVVGHAAVSGTTHQAAGSGQPAADSGRQAAGRRPGERADTLHSADVRCGGLMSGGCVFTNSNPKRKRGIFDAGG